VTNRLRDALVSISPALERAVGNRLGHAGIRDLLVAYPTPTALRTAGRARIAGKLKPRRRRVCRVRPRTSGWHGSTRKATPASWTARAAASQPGTAVGGPRGSEEAILHRRDTYLEGPHAIGWALGEAHSTVSRVLARHHRPPSCDIDRARPCRSSPPCGSSSASRPLPMARSGRAAQPSAGSCWRSGSPARSSSRPACPNGSSSPRRPSPTSTRTSTRISSRSPR
jgi:hypothetical protein